MLATDTILKNQLNQKFKLIVKALTYIIYSNIHILILKVNTQHLTIKFTFLYILSNLMNISYVVINIFRMTYNILNLLYYY